MSVTLLKRHLPRNKSDTVKGISFIYDKICFIILSIYFFSALIRSCIVIHLLNFYLLVISF